MTVIVGKFSLKSKVYFNTQSLEYLKHITGSKAFIVSDTIMETLGYLQKVIDYLNEIGISSTVYSGVKPDPDVNVIVDGLKPFKDQNFDVLIAIGGGSAIDTAKGILYFASTPEFDPQKLFIKPLFIAIPSTSGTGSEVTDFSVITSNAEKTCIVDELIAPDIAILDSTCIQHVPQHIVADTGIDVLVHAIEAYVSTNASDFTDALAEKAITLIFENLVTLHKDTNNSFARDRIQNASCMAGMAFTNTGLGINHSLAHAFGGTFHISHGRSNALLLGAVMEFNADLKGNANGYAAEKYSKLAKLLQLQARTSREGTINFLSAVNSLKKSLGIESNIKTLGIKQQDFENGLDQMAKTALLDRCTPTNPVVPTHEDIIHIYKKSYQ